MRHESRRPTSESDPHDAKPLRAKYRRPRLLRYGPIGSLTSGGSGPKMEVGTAAQKKLQKDMFP